MICIPLMIIQYAFVSILILIACICESIINDHTKNLKGILTFSVWLCTPLDQSDGVLGKLFEGLNELHNLVHG